MSEKPPVSTPLLDAPSPAARKLELLRQHFPGAVQVDADGRVRVNATAMQQALDPANPAGIRVAEDGYELRWVGKREAYHTAFLPAEKILQPLPEDSLNWDGTGNVLLKGDNLDALRLLRQSYFGQVKLIYIDPPYNTQSDAFIYRDDFSQRQGEILQQLGYSKDSAEYIKNIYGARTHSGWLSFMYPRLLLARDLLKDDGVIFISIDDNEQAQLKLLCDEVFGQENFVANVIWQKKYAAANDHQSIAPLHDHVLVYARSEQWKTNLLPRNESADRAYRYTDEDGTFRPDNYLCNKSADERPSLYYPITNPNTGEEIWPKRTAVWRYSQERHKKNIEKNLVYWGKDGKSSVPAFKRYRHNLKNGGLSIPTTWWTYTECGHNDEAQKETASILAPKIFSTPKPIRLVDKILRLGTGDDDLILDFFAGSGTTAEAVMRLNAEDDGNRRFILVQIPQPIDPARQKEAHHFVSKTLGKPEATIFEITAERIRRAGAALKSEHPQLDTGFRVYALANDPDALVLKQPLAKATQADLLGLQQRMTTPQPGQLPRVLANLLLAEGLPLSTRIEALIDGAAYRAGDVLLILQAVDTPRLTELLQQARQAGAPIHAISVYAPWVADDNFLLGLNTMLESLHLSEDKLRLRG